MKYFIIYGWADCPFCVSAVELLQEKGEKHMFVHLDHDDQLLEYFKKHMYKAASTLVGGYTDLITHLETE